MEAFNQYFEIVEANTTELKTEVYKLRFQVYCVENNYENPEKYPDGLEYDEFDQHALHYLIRHRRTGEYAATMRLIIPDVQQPEKLFPIEKYCEIDNDAIFQKIDRSQLGEVSRFCVSKGFKRRKNESQTIEGIHNVQDQVEEYFTPTERRVFPNISIALIACFIKASYLSDTQYLIACMEQSFYRFMSQLGIDSNKIGTTQQQYFPGERFPACIKISDMLESVADKNLDLWKFITNNGELTFSKH